ncbi:MAG: electron transfer flavoprotein subunit beta/FixA family protein [Candidatus Marinimicrobia bacterium]|jgi:electron transfer flavoprotein beta subunit|nr:electron transfer flavoprotein subunit beta/FixA family protein [Candidatus Neomarinimicrobiota bacterium]MDP7071581.1 electron transfer flavoprotein subunit beta/FixA family protein [Candidatus Neomarinimicrobiota bacterium]
MKIAVLIKQVPGSDSPLRMNPGGDWIDENVVAFEMNESDSYALEEAMQITERTGGGEVVAVCMGADRVQKIIREALAKGADRGIHIKEDGKGEADPLVIAKLLSEALKDENFDLVLSGLQSDDLGMGQTGVLIGGMLGMPTATLVMATEIQDGNIRVKRELEAGWFQWVTMHLPASLAIQSGLNQPRYPSLKGIMGAKKKEIKVIEKSALNGGESKQSLTNLHIPQAEKQTEMISGEADAAVTRLVEVLKSEIRVL